MLSVRPDKPVDPIIVELLSHVDLVATALEIPYIVSGATARDLLLNHVYGHDVPRPTRDVDVGIGIRSDQDFDRIRTRLLEDRRFATVNQVPHQLRFQPAASRTSIPLDILPFSIPASAGIAQNVVVDLPGFEEALTKAEQLSISEKLAVPIASIPGQTLLKLAAWVDRRAASPNKDAVDLLQLFRRYGDSGNEDRLFGDKIGLLESADFDIEIAGAMLLGEDVRAIASPATYERLTATFTPKVIRGPFVTQISSGYLWEEENKVTRAETLAVAFFDKFTNRST